MDAVKKGYMLCFNVKLLMLSQVTGRNRQSHVLKYFFANVLLFRLKYVNDSDTTDLKIDKFILR